MPNPQCTNFSTDQIYQFLTKSLDLAAHALQENSYPIGAVFVNANGTVLAETSNEYAHDHDVTAHAELLGLRQLSEHADKDLGIPLTLYTSLEPCFGCSFFLARSSVTQIYSALKDPHKGGISMLKEQAQFVSFFKNMEIEHTLFADLQAQSAQLLQTYFEQNGNEAAARLYQL